jgi:RecA/RadA recombinase
MKKENEENNEAKFDFGALNKKINKFSEYGSLINDSKLTVIKDWIGTGNYTLNAQISGSIYGGIPTGKITIFSGENSTGKTFIALSTAAQAQRQGYGVVWIDTEGALITNTTENFGIQPDTFRYESLNTVESLSKYLKNLLEELKTIKQTGVDPKVLIVVDSLGNLSTTKEMDDINSGAGKVDMTRAKQLKALFRVITSDLSYLQIPLLAINHVYSTLSMYGGNEQSGGSGSKFASSTILEFTKAKLKDDVEQVGIIITSKITKSRFTKANIRAKLHIRFDKGMNPYVGLQDYFDWETVGIESGKVNNGEFEPAKAGRGFAVKILDKTIPKKKIFTSEDFNREQLDLFEKVMKPIFSFDTTIDDTILFLDKIEEDDE